MLLLLLASCCSAAVAAAAAVSCSCVPVMLVGLPSWPAAAADFSTVSAAQHTGLTAAADCSAAAGAGAAAGGVGVAGSADARCLWRCLCGSNWTLPPLLADDLVLPASKEGTWRVTDEVWQCYVKLAAKCSTLSLCTRVARLQHPSLLLDSRLQAYTYNTELALNTTPPPHTHTPTVRRMQQSAATLLSFPADCWQQFNSPMCSLPPDVPPVGMQAKGCWQATPKLLFSHDKDCTERGLTDSSYKDC